MSPIIMPTAGVFDDTAKIVLPTLFETVIAPGRTPSATPPTGSTRRPEVGCRGTTPGAERLLYLKRASERFFGVAERLRTHPLTSILDRGRQLGARSGRGACDGDAKV